MKKVPSPPVSLDELTRRASNHILSARNQVAGAKRIIDEAKATLNAAKRPAQ